MTTSKKEEEEENEIESEKNTISNIHTYARTNQTTTMRCMKMKESETERKHAYKRFLIKYAEKDS